MALIVFDLASNFFNNLAMSSAESLHKWIDFVREAGRNDIKIYIVGNKCDLEE
jgi:GTPase SAR1 family protein